MDSYSIVEYYAYQTQRECGYCNGPNTNCNHGNFPFFFSLIFFIIENVFFGSNS